MRTPYITRHRRGWKYQRAVPKHLQPIVGKTAWVAYLGSVGERDATMKARKFATEHDSTIATLNALSLVDHEFLTRRGGVEGLNGYTQHLETEFAVMSTLPEYFADLPAEDRERAHQAGLSDGDLALTAIGARKRALTVLQPELAHAQKLVRKLGSGRPGTSLDELVDLWESVKKPRNRRSPDRYRRSFRILADVLGADTDPRTLTQGDIAKFRDHNDEQGLSEALQLKHLDHLRAVFAVAVSENVLPINPAAGIKPRKINGRRVDAIEKRKPFTAAQLRMVLDKVADTKWGGRRHADVLWILKLLTYTGARANEVAQLRKEDVRTVDGVPVIVIHDASEGQSVKNNSSVRSVPLHPEICSAFLDYVASAAEPWVFGTMKPYAEGGRAGWIIRHFPPSGAQHAASRMRR